MVAGASVIVMSLTVGAAYVGGVSAKAAAARGDAHRIAGAAYAGFSEDALAAAVGGLDPSALAIARRHDPYARQGQAERDRAALTFASRLEAPKGERGSSVARSSDLDCLTQAAYYEARGEGRDGMRAVVQVVLNRVRSPAYPKSVCGVVFQGAGRRIGCQFSFTCDGSLRSAVNGAAWARARSIASSALAGESFSRVGGATHFHTTAVTPGWRHALIRVDQVGDHVFYRVGRRGEAAAPRVASRPTRELISVADTAPTPGPTPYAPNGEAAVSTAEAKPPASEPKVATTSLI